MKLKKSHTTLKHPKTGKIHLMVAGGYDATVCGQSFDSLDDDDGTCFLTVYSDVITCQDCIDIIKFYKSL